MMGRIILFAAALLAALPAYGQSVVDHYRSLMAQTKDDSAYILTQTGSSWRVKGPEGNANIQTVVDIPNGFIQLNDEGTGGGNVVTDIALFKPGSGGPILGLAQRFYNVADPLSGKARFYQLTGGRWMPLSAAMLPALTPFIFVPDRTTRAPADDELKPVVVYLPRVGTTVNIYLTPHAFRNCPEQNWLAAADPVQGCKDLAAAPNHVELTFDVARGGFSVARRDKKDPPKLQ